jgi:hypothetical protein
MNGELHVDLDVADFLAVFPLKDPGHARLIGSIRESAAKDHEHLQFEDVRDLAIQNLKIEVKRVNWFSTYRVHHRVAQSFRKGRAFLLGDAAHIHSPVGGQGMNTGLGDAMNLAWKLAAVIGGRANEDLLDTYEPERIAFARRLVATTDRVFKAASSDGRLAGVVRTQIVPRIIPRITGTSLGQRLFFRALSQTGIEYRATAWSTGRAGPVHGGDRLPWVEPARRGSDDNFTPLRSLDWQAHVYGAPLADLRALCEERRLPLHVFPSSAPAKLAGFRDGAVYLVRPDGYVGAVVDAGGAAASLAEYLDVHGIRCR